MKRLPRGMKILSNGDIRLYSTQIVSFANGYINLNTGGWDGPHTKKCMNLALQPLGFSVAQKKHKWSVYKGKTKVVDFVNNHVCSFPIKEMEELL